jgi:hypothetical protein
MVLVLENLLIYRREERAFHAIWESLRHINTPDYNEELPLREEDFSQELVELVVEALKDDAEGIAYFQPNENGGFTKNCNQNGLLRIYVEDRSSLIYQNFKETLGKIISSHREDILSNKVTLEFQKDGRITVNAPYSKLVS